MEQNKNNIYKILFLNYGQNAIYEIYAKSITQSSMYGFLELAELIFNKSTGVVVDPSQERVKTEFSGVKKTYIPVHSVIRIDEVDSEGVAKIKDAKIGEIANNVAKFPTISPAYTPE